MNKKLIRLTESDLHRIVKESVKRALNEINSITANSAFVKARDAYNKMVANGQENTPQAQKLLRQMNTFQSYNDWDSDALSYDDENWEEKMNKQMNTPNQYGNTPSKYLTDYANAYGINNFDPSRFMKTDRQYERNGDKYDYNNMSQADMNMHQQLNNAPAMQADMTPSRMKSPEQLGLSYGGGKKGFLGFGKKSNQWVANPNPNQ